MRTWKRRFQEWEIGKNPRKLTNPKTPTCESGIVADATEMEAGSYLPEGVVTPELQDAGQGQTIGSPPGITWRPGATWRSS